ncbi:probable E3 ubiquitin-protein ligase HERC4 isoform X10 [Dermacentor silvarum]|uniref:probable E3 ubiquitin-protein ligase HERC4 isoform X10 n=1 Tax=Dermacentor silvarum TaxID=543639 RepID=UPI0021009C03|nr:probable E3 ubiquitin-protein ligase HERC4 isoform X10 [Dermacentor silvarum]
MLRIWDAFEVPSMKRSHSEAGTGGGSGRASPSLGLSPGSGAPMMMYSWGLGPNGELGLTQGKDGVDTETPVSQPERVRRFGTRAVREVACGHKHTLVLLASGSVYSCGANDFGQLGQDRSMRKLEQVAALAAHEIRAVACGEAHSLALSDAGQVFSWGCNRNGQLGCGTEEESRLRPKVIKKLATLHIVQIACGTVHCLALANNGELFSWGGNTSGQLGLGRDSTGNERLPRRVAHLVGVPLAQVACGATHSVGLTPSGTVFVWGRNSCGQLGLSDQRDRVHPTVLKPLRSQRIKHVCCGENHTAALTADGGVFTFGAGTYGQLGHGVKVNEAVPRRVVELMGTTITQLSCGRCHTVAYAPQSGKMYIFGLGMSGQLGNGTLESSALPVTIPGLWHGVAHPSQTNRSPSPRPQTSQIAAAQSSGVSTADPDAPLVVYRVIAGWDRNFLLCHEYKADSPRPVDQRFHQKETQILSLDNDILEQLPFLAATEQVPQELLAYLETVFASCACLNASYLKEDDGHFNCSELNPGVDLEAARHGFHCIQDAKNPSVPEVVGACLEEMVKGLAAGPSDIEAMRVLLLLPLCHFFRDLNHYLETLVGKYCLCVSRLSTRAADVLNKWWSLLSEAQFEDLLTIFKECVVYILARQMQTKKNHGHLKLALDVLAKLNTVNKECGGLVTYEHFYIPDVTDKVDVQLDYIQWIQEDNEDRSNKVYFCDYPFVFNAQAKTLILQTDSHIQMQQAMESACQQTIASMILPVVPPSNPYLVLYVGRENIVNDTLNQLADQSAADLKKPLKVQFHGEDAVDAGGVKKEFFLLLLKEILDPKYGMFTEYPESRCIWFNTQSFEEDVMYYLIGIVCGLAIYNFTIIALPFPLVLYKKLLKQKPTLKDLQDLSPTLAKGLQNLLDYDGDDLENTFFLTFEVSVEHYGHTLSHELKKGGSHIKVTKENRQEYVDLYVDFVLNTSVKHCFEAFSQGFYKVCSSKVLDLFHAQELMVLVVGSENYNWNELEKNAEYKDEFHKNHPTVRMFWRVFHSLDYEEKKKFLLFLTGSDRIPILGMSEIKVVLQPMKVDDSHLPVAHTCFNLLDLPMYSSEVVMREKLRLAIQNAQGFGLV